MRTVFYLLILLCVVLNLKAHASKSPIIYGQSGGTPCAYNLIAKACVPTSSGGTPGGTSGLLQYNNGGSFGGVSGVFWNGTQLQVPEFSNSDPSVVMISGAVSNILTVRAASGGANGGFSMGSQPAFAFIQGTRSDLANVQDFKLNWQGGQTYLGHAVNSLNFTGYTSCTALTTNASDVVGCTASDERLKKDIVPFQRGLEAIKDIGPISFKFKDPGDLGVEHTGFSAQNVMKAIPEAVIQSADGFYQLDYWAIVATQSNAIKELLARIEALEGAAKKSVKEKLPMRPIHVVKRPVPEKCVGSKKFCESLKK